MSPASSRMTFCAAILTFNVLEYYSCWCNDAKILIISVFNALSIGKGLVAAVLMCMKWIIIYSGPLISLRLKVVVLLFIKKLEKIEISRARWTVKAKIPCVKSSRMMIS